MERFINALIDRYEDTNLWDAEKYTDYYDEDDEEE